MIQLRLQIPNELSEELEAHFCELEESPWMLSEQRVDQKTELHGFFETERDARKAFSNLAITFPQLPGGPELLNVEERDWKDAYKEHFKPWTAGNLHWVPSWERDGYPVPEAAQAVYLDPGMAFGTGNHESTRLCAIRLVEAADRWGDSLARRSAIDAGCGSGILAISAAKLGFGNVFGFDIDPDAVSIAIENAAENDLAGAVRFEQGDLQAGLGHRQADLVMANILANVLLDHADLLLDAVRPGGLLALSGILAKEANGVREDFERHAEARWGGSISDLRKDGEWADVLLERPE